MDKNFGQLSHRMTPSKHANMLYPSEQLVPNCSGNSWEWYIGWCTSQRLPAAIDAHAKSRLRRFLQARVRRYPIQELSCCIDLIGEIAMRELHEFGNEFVAPRGIFRYQNPVTQDCIDFPAKPRGL
jgi:hypothetical protein